MAKDEKYSGEHAADVADGSELGHLDARGDKYHTLFHSVADPIFIIERESGRLLDANRAAIERYGYSPEELLELTIFDLHPPEERERLRQLMAERRIGDPHTYTHLTRHGSRLQVEVHTHRLDYEGRDAWVTVARAISDRVHATDALIESEERYRNLVELSPEAILVVRDERIAFINEAGADLLGADGQAALVGHSLSAYVHPDYLYLTRQRIARVIGSGSAPPVAAKFVRLDGATVEVEVAGAGITFQGQPAVQVVARDLSERRRSEERLRVEKAYFENLFESAPQAIVLVDRDGVIGRANREFIRLFGFSLEELVGRRVDDLIVPEELRDEAVAVTRAVSAGRPCQLETQRQCKDGSLIDVAIQGAPIETDEGQIAVYGIYSDISDRKGLEQRLRQSQKLEAIGQLAGGIAHDFNNLLTAILGNSEILLNTLDARDPLYLDVEEIRRAGDRAAALTRQLLAFSRRQYLKPVVLDLNATVAETQKMLGRLIGENIELATDLAGDLESIRADPGQIEQVIVNLAVNARDAMPEGGRLAITTSNVDVDSRFARMHQPITPGRYVLMAVEDTGMGMDPETRGRIFEPFFTTKEQGKGTGLGLSTVYGIVKQSDGYIWADSALGKGTAFRIYFPLAPGEHAEREPVEPIQTLGGRETILLVEDEKSVRVLLQRSLSGLGYSVLYAADAEEALALSERYADPIDLLITDIYMPGSDGRDLSAKLCRERPGLKVMYISGYLDSLSLGGRPIPTGEFLQKPFTPEILARKVKEVLAAR